MEDETDKKRAVREKDLTLRNIDSEETLILLLDGESNLSIGGVVQHEALFHFLVDATVAKLQSTFWHTRKNCLTRRQLRGIH